MLTNGVVGCRLKNGVMDNITLDTHRAVAANDAAGAKTVPVKK